jgi:sec-independent protein translocase protein TatB
MLPDLSAAHIFLLVVVALVVVGPKDLPSLLRKIGQFMARLRGMANEFRASFDEMARQSELDELRREVAAMRSAAAKPMEEFRNAAADLHGDLNKGLSDFSSATPVESTVSADPAATPMLPIADPEPTPSPAKPRKAKAAPAKVAAKTAVKSKAASPKAASSRAAPKKAKPKATPEAEPGA